MIQQPIIIKKEILNYLGHLSTQQKEIELSVVKAFAGVDEAWWDGKANSAKMDRRFAQMETGNVKDSTLVELEDWEGTHIKASNSRKWIYDKQHNIGYTFNRSTTQVTLFTVL